jgi:cytochrome c553
MIRLRRKLALSGAALMAAVRALLQLLTSQVAPVPGDRSSVDPRPRSERGNVRRWLFRGAAFLVLAALGGFLFAASGIMPIKASSGHWPITVWLLDFAMRRSVVTHSLGIEPPPLDDRALVLKGAGHYEIGCRPCHGSPDLHQLPRIAQSMTPQPPNLTREIPKWDSKELFYIVKHGVKFTGMPAWPAQKRDDEVWAMVAFLLTMPMLTADDYERLTRSGDLPPGPNVPMHDLLGPQQAPLAVRESCGRCHGADGGGRGLGAFPKLAGQKPEYFVASMRAYASGRRSSGIMEPIAVGLSQGATAELARYYASLESKTTDKKRQGTDTKSVDPSAKPLLNTVEPSKSRDPKSTTLSMSTQHERDLTSTAEKPGSPIERGRVIAMRGIPGQRVPACNDCHGPSDFPRNPNYPNLAGQFADYLVLQLTLFKKHARGGTAYAHLMRPVAAGLTAEQMRDVSLFYESLPN